MDLKELEFQRLLFLFILLLAATKKAAATSYKTDNEGVPPCFPEEFLNQVRCCDKVDDVKDYLTHSHESIETLEKRLIAVESFAREAIVNVSEQSFKMSTKLSETYQTFTKETLANYAKELTDTAGKVDRLSSESSTLAKSSQDIQQRLDSVVEDISITNSQKKEEFSQIVTDAVAESHLNLMKTVNETIDDVEDLRKKLNTLKEGVTVMGAKMATAEADLQRLDSFIKNLCLPPFSWQGDGCYYMPFTKKSWQKARDICIDLGGDLVVPRDYLHFVNWLPSLNLDDDVWVGASDIKTEGTWVWVNGKPLDIEAEEFFNWDHPSKKENEDCLEICSHSGFRPTDYDCEHENYFMCQKSVEVL